MQIFLYITLPITSWHTGPGTADPDCCCCWRDWISAWCFSVSWWFSAANCCCNCCWNWTWAFWPHVSHVDIYKHESYKKCVRNWSNKQTWLSLHVLEYCNALLPQVSTQLHLPPFGQFLTACGIYNRANSPFPPYRTGGVLPKTHLYNVSSDMKRGIIGRFDFCLFITQVHRP